MATVSVLTTIHWVNKAKNTISIYTFANLTKFSNFSLFPIHSLYIHLGYPPPIWGVVSIKKDWFLPSSPIDRIDAVTSYGKQVGSCHAYRVVNCGNRKRKNKKTKQKSEGQINSEKAHKLSGRTPRFSKQQWWGKWHFTWYLKHHPSELVHWWHAQRQKWLFRPFEWHELKNYSVHNKSYSNE